MFLAITPYALASFYEFSDYNSNFGISYTHNKDATSYINYIHLKLNNVNLESERTLGLNINYGYLPNIRVSFQPKLYFTKASTLDMPPAPGAILQIMNIGSIHIGSVQNNSLAYFLGGSIGATYRNFKYEKIINMYYNTGYSTRYRSEFLEYQTHIVNLQANGVIGLLSRLKINSESTVIPFFAVHYIQDWFQVSENSNLFEDESNYTFNGQAGLEIGILPNMSLTGSWIFSFETDDSLFSFSINFH